MIDIDSFHDVNDTLGRAGGDTMLCSIAERLKAALPSGALFGRFEDDAFAVIATSHDAGVLAELAEKLSASLAAPIYMDQSWQISASIGTAKAPDDGTTGDELQRNAALALRTAKRGGRGSVRHFVPEIYVEHAERRFFLRELERAIGEVAFDVHYQPVVAAEGGGMIGVEALLRWNHPTRGAIPPSLFIPLAEKSGLMIGSASSSCAARSPTARAGRTCSSPSTCRRCRSGAAGLSSSSPPRSRKPACRRRAWCSSLPREF